MKKPNNVFDGEEFLVLHELVKAARSNLTKPTWDYLIGAAETETTFRRNRLALDRIAFRPRVLRDVEHVDLGTKLLGEKLRLPVILAPIGSMQDLVIGGGQVPTKAAARFGILHMISSTCAPGLEEVAQCVRYPKIFQLYIRGDQNWVDDHIHRAIDEGYIAFCFTIDLDAYGRRERDLAKRYVTTGRRKAVNPEYQMRFSWKDIERIRKKFDIPIILKGIATFEDAEIALDHEIDVVYVSNHGGRQLDHGRGGIDVLPEVVDAVKGKVKVIFDGGIMRGTDIVKAIAIGADVVGIGRLQGLAAAGGGEEGLVRMLELLEIEVETCLRLLGVTRLLDLNRTFLQFGESNMDRSPLSAFPLIREGY